MSTTKQTNRTEIENSLMPLILVLARRLRLLVGLPLLATVLAYAYSQIAEPVFIATARILPPQYNENTVSAMTNRFGGESQVGNSALTLKNPTDLFVGILHSRTIGAAVIETLALKQHYGVASDYAGHRALQSATDILAGKDGIVSISVSDRCPRMAAKIANAYVEEFYHFSAGLAQKEAGRRASFFEQAMSRAREELLRADVELSLIEQNTGFTRLNGQDEAIVQAAAEIQAEISAREVQLRTMASYATDTNPDVRLVSEELGNLRLELERLAARDGSDGNPILELGRVPEVLMSHTQKQRNVTYWEQVVLLLGQFTELGKIDERRDMSLFQLLDQAVPPEFKSKPRTAVNMILAAIGTGLFCLLWVLGTAYIDQRRRQSRLFEHQWRSLASTLREAFSLKGANR